jgi:hypothetical protein
MQTRPRSDGRGAAGVVETIRRLRDEGLRGEDLAHALYQRGIRPEQIDQFIPQQVNLEAPWVDQDGHRLGSYSKVVAQKLSFAGPVLPGDPSIDILSDPQKPGDPFLASITTPTAPCPSRNTTLLVPKRDEKGTRSPEGRVDHRRLQDVTEPHLLPALRLPDGSLDHNGVLRLFKACVRITSERIGWIRQARPLHAERGMLDPLDLRQEAFLALLSARESFHGIAKHRGTDRVKFGTYYRSVLTRRFLNLAHRAPLNPRLERLFDPDQDGDPVIASDRSDHPHTRIPEWLYLRDVMAQTPNSGLTVAHVAGFTDGELGSKERIKKQRQRAQAKLRERIRADEGGD